MTDNIAVTGTHRVERQFSTKGGVPKATIAVRISDADADGYYTIEYLDKGGDVLGTDTRASYRVEESVTPDGQYSVAVPKEAPYPGGVRTTHAIETLACLKKSVESLDSRQARLAVHSAKCTVVGK